MFLLLLAFGVLLLSLAGTGLMVTILCKHQVMDVPNARSNHTRPTPRGGGIAVITALFTGILAASFTSDYNNALEQPLLLGVALLALISFYDDLKGVSIRWRLLCQIAAIALILYATPFPGLLFQGLLPAFIDHIFMGIGLLWFINLYNFMDGIDGITGSQTASIGIGVALVALIAGLPPVLLLYGIVTAAAALGFLVWNWHPARIFIGDVGSVTLGYITGWLLLLMATAGFWQAALIIPAYYITDSSFTLIKRILEGKKFWESHSEHFYQQAVRSGHSHAQVSRTIIAINALLVIIALISTKGGIYALASLVLAYMAVAAMLYYWHKQKQQAPS